MDLFSDEKTRVELPNAEIAYLPEFYDLDKANELFHLLRKIVKWQQDDIKIFGKTYAQPRLTAFYSEDGIPYKYSNITMMPYPMSEELLAIKSDVETVAQHRFNSMLLNLYRTGSDSNGWHADNEKSLGKNPVIASLSLGAERKFQFKHRKLKKHYYSINLKNGSLLIMKGEMQHHWLHQIPKTKREVGERINITLRILKGKVEIPQSRLS